jgi:hypothetical protein
MSENADDQQKRSASQTQKALEQEKLLLEIEFLKTQAGLEYEKLAEEIQQLKDAPRRDRRTLVLGIGTATLSAITTLVVAFVGGYISLQVERITDRQKSAEAYGALLQNLGSSNVPARSGAVVGLLCAIMPQRALQRRLD